MCCLHERACLAKAGAAQSLPFSKDGQGCCHTLPSQSHHAARPACARCIAVAAAPSRRLLTASCKSVMCPLSSRFWSEPWDNDAAVAACKETWGVTPRPLWATVQWGGKKLGAASNIVFSNGLLDPWSGGGVLGNVSAAKDVVAVIIPEGGWPLVVRSLCSLPSPRRARCAAWALPASEPCTPLPMVPLCSAAARHVTVATPCNQSI